jgi:Flp pilus assembly protein TadG
MSRNPHRDERGAAAVEFAIVATIFFMLVFGIIDFGFAFHSWNNAVNAAREGARLAAVDPYGPAITSRVTTSASGLDPTKLTIQFECSKFSNGSYGPFAACPDPQSVVAAGDIIRVTVNYQYNMLTPIGSFVPGLGTSLTLHSSSESRYEG